MTGKGREGKLQGWPCLVLAGVRRSGVFGTPGTVTWPELGWFRAAPALRAALLRCHQEGGMCFLSFPEV